TVLPVPVVGALVGGLVGQLCATLIAQGLRTAVVRAREYGLPEEQIALLEAEACAAVETAVALADAEHALGEQHNAYVTSRVVPLVDDALHAVAQGSDGSLTLMIELTAGFAGQPLFRTVDEFDEWMNDPTSTLVLNPNAPRSTYRRLQVTNCDEPGTAGVATLIDCPMCPL
ncbi:hypothetical protein, partial [Pseudonocardia pini]|uniref:hypothetical protein n=1 Tax=Pseudonocardia pini TaxID=2758030 RepID=UPI001C688B8C